MLIGAECILAKVTYYKLDKEKKYQYEMFSNLKEKYKTECIDLSSNRARILFKDKIGFYEVDGYLNDFDKNDFKKMIESLSIQLEKDNKIIRIINILPEFLKSLFLKITKNYRLKQHMKKKYLNKHEVEKFKKKSRFK